MKTIGVLARKGGAGKSTLTLHWAVEAERQGRGKVAVIDMDPQQTSVKWSKRRLLLGKQTPAMLVASAGDLQDALNACDDSGMGFVLIDTPPHVEAPCREAAKLSDLVVIPCGPSAPDLEAIGATIHILQETKTPGVIVLNKGRPGSSINHKAMAVLQQYGLPVCPAQVMRRAALADAFTDGRAVVELEPGGKAAADITQSWKWIVKQVT
ncbi:MAG: ParA family protein [Thermoproteota archaeon]|nr:ParA family protein [Thermoproteota archaeon]